VVAAGVLLLSRTTVSGILLQLLGYGWSTFPQATEVPDRMVVVVAAVLPSAVVAVLGWLGARRSDGGWRRTGLGIVLGAALLGPLTLIAGTVREDAAAVVFGGLR
jgi:hypothetical protein